MRNIPEDNDEVNLQFIHFIKDSEIIPDPSVDQSDVMVLRNVSVSSIAS
jgi:hypothetical protein